MARKLSNDFQAVQLLSLHRLSMASEINPRDRGGPYVVMQNAYDPEDPTMTPTDYLLGRNGSWLATKWFIRLPVPERRQMFVFGTAAEVIQLMDNLPHLVNVLRPGEDPATAADSHEDELSRMIVSGPNNP